MAESRKDKIITALWIVWIVSIIVLLFAFLIALSSGEVTTSIVFISLFGVDLISFIIVLVFGKKKNTKKEETSSSTKASSSGYTSAPIRRTLSDETLGIPEFSE